jgi:ACR3 family arsenite transporter
MQALRDKLEHRQIAIYFGAVALALIVAGQMPATARLAAVVNPALAFMLFVTFLQVPLAHLGRAFTHLRFLAALVVTNFLVIPLLVACLLPLAPADPLIRLGVLLVLLAPCIDYVVTFAHLGRADARALLAATPVLLVAQMALLPVYLRILLGDAAAAALIQPAPFIDAFIWLIAAPLVLAGAVQYWAVRTRAGAQAAAVLGVLPVPATALVLFVVVASVLPQLGQSRAAALAVIPVYIAFAVLAPLAGWLVARLCRLAAPAARAVAFSGATRNSLVILPLALAVPGPLPLLPAIIVTQTLVELIAELVYVRAIARLGAGGN